MKAAVILVATTLVGRDRQLLLALAATFGGHVIGLSADNFRRKRVQIFHSAQLKDEPHLEINGIILLAEPRIRRSDTLART
jgi:hypothetical protein